MPQNSRGAFPYPMFGRFSHRLSALVGRTILDFGRLCLLWSLDIRSPISDSLCANSRTLDIGKAPRLFCGIPYLRFCWVMLVFVLL
jgi:hypothetical protein